MIKLFIVKYLLDQLSFFRYDLKIMLGDHVKQHFEALDALWDEVNSVIDKYDTEK